MDDLDPVAPKDVGALLAELVEGEAFERSFSELLRQPELRRELAREMAEETGLPRSACWLVVWAVQQGLNAMAGTSVQWLAGSAGRRITGLIAKCPGCAQMLDWLRQRAGRQQANAALRAKLDEIAKGGGAPDLDDMPEDLDDAIKLQIRLLQQGENADDKLDLIIDILSSSPPTPQIPADTPHPTAHFKGRTEHLATLRKALLSGTTAAICAMQGMGGVGKSTLAAQIAAELGTAAFDGGMQWVDMHGTADSGRAPLTPLEAMREVILALHPDAPAQLNEAETARLYRQVLSGRRMLLIFDNAADEEQVADLVPPRPSAMIVTSRKQLGLEGGTIVNLDVLSEGDSKALFAETLGDEFSLDDAQLTAFAERCGFLPLALVGIAAALRESSWGVAEFLAQLPTELGPVLARLQPSLDALKHDNPALADRLTLLAIMPAEFDTAAAAAIWQTTPADTASGLQALTRRSLLQRRRDEQGRTHFRLHDLIRDLLTPELTEESETTARRRHAHHFHKVIVDANASYLKGGPHLLTALQTFDQHRPHIEAAQSWASQNLETDPKAAQLTASFPNTGIYLIALRLHSQTQIQWLEAALTAARQLNNRQLEGNALGNLGLAHAELGDPQRAITYYEQQLTITREIGDRRGEGAALGNLGTAHARLGDPQRAITFYEQDLTIAREIGNRRGEGATLNNLGNAHADLGDPQRAITHYEQRLTIAREIGDRLGENTALWNLSQAHEKTGDMNKAIECAKNSWVIHREMDDPYLPTVEAWLRRHGVEL